MGFCSNFNIDCLAYFANSVIKNMSTLIKNANLVLTDQVQKADILVEDKIISKIARDIPALDEWVVIDAQGKYILPGFVDIHNHGSAGFDFSFGKYDTQKDAFDDSDQAILTGLESALSFYKSRGTTKVLLTSMAAPLDKLKNSFSHLKNYLSAESPNSTIVAGINLEGTFLKDPTYAGAQNTKYFYPISKDTIDQLQVASGNLLKIVNIPPEHGEEGNQLIEYLVKLGIKVAGGHTGAYGDEFSAAVDSGLCLSVHFLNGPSRRFTKSFRQGGAEEIMVKSDKVSLEIICDGYHVDPAYVRDIIARKEIERVIMITDSMFANGLDDLKQFSMFGLTGAVSQNRQYLQMLGSEDTLFGSVLSPNTGFQNVLNWLTTEMTGVWKRHHDAYSLQDSLVMAAKLFSSNPARLINIDQPDNSPGTGSIEVGKYADLIIADIKDGDTVEFKIEKVLSEGKY